MITNYKESDVKNLNAKTPSSYVGCGWFCVIDEDNVQHELIPMLFYFTNARYEVVEYPGGIKGVQFLSTLEKQVLRRFPETWEGEKQLQVQGIIEINEEAFFPSTLWKSEGERFVETENGRWIDVNSLPFPGFYEKDGVFYKV